jgi:hypothetical protein
MQIITELSKNACGLLLFYRHVCDPVSGHVPRPPDAEDSTGFGLPTAPLGDGPEVDIDRDALLRAHRELRVQGLIELRCRNADQGSMSPTQIGDVYLVRDTLH